MSSPFLKAIAAVGMLLCGLAQSVAARELRVCADPNNLPFSNAAGEGFENELVQLIARSLEATPAYTWRAQRRGFLRETLKNGLCDVVPGLPANLEGVRTTRPYYRSTYVFVTPHGAQMPNSYDDPLLRTAKIGVQLVGDDGWNAPPAHALSRRGIIQNVRGYHLYSDYALPNPPARILDAVGREIDIAIAWGPLAGFFAQRSQPPLAIGAVTPSFDGPRLPMVFDIAVAVRKEDLALAEEIDAVIEAHKPAIDDILERFSIPRLDNVRRQDERQP
jgi:mxaJ protein